MPKLDLILKNKKEQKPVKNIYRTQITNIKNYNHDYS